MEPKEFTGTLISDLIELTDKTMSPDGAVLTSSHGLEDELEYERRTRG